MGKILNYKLLFQFHKGTIKTYWWGWCCLWCTGFQFHKGTIKTVAACFKLRTIGNFNSIKVRLKLAGVDEDVLIHQFQFHKGTIKTIKVLIYALTLIGFQFHKGTIKTHFEINLIQRN